MATNKVQYMGRNTDIWPSPRIWADCPIAEIEQLGVGYGIFCDFVSIQDDGTISSAAERMHDGVSWWEFGGSGSTILPVGDELGGVIQILTTNDNVATNMQTSCRPFQISSNKGKLWFECRFKTNTITTAEQGFFIGLAESLTQSATVPLTATSALADVNLVGFHKPEANTTAFDASYKADGVTAVEVNSDIGTLAADTYLKVGMVFDGASTLSFYVNGTLQTSTKTIPNATGTDFPADALMGLCIADQAGSNNDAILEVDWIRCYQLR